MPSTDAGVLWFLRLLDITPYQGTYDIPFVALSVGVAVLSMYVALSVADRIVASSRRSVRLIWTSVGAIVMGGGIWSMHFIGMLAFSLPCGVGYNPLLTLVSMLPGMLASGVALFVLSRRESPSQPMLFVCALLVGAGIGAMHYSGMAAMQPAALMRFDIRIVALSVVVAVALAYLALVIRARLKHFRGHPIMRAMLPATVMGLAIACMHYVAMEAAVFYPMMGIRISGTIYSSTSLALVIGFVSVSVGLITLGVAALVGRGELTASLLAEIARREHIQQDLIRAREEAEAANAAKSQFLATMSHEIRTPLNGVIGIANLLTSTTLDARQTRLVANLSRSGQALLAIISDILDFSKIEAGRLELFEADFEPREALADVADLFCERCAALGLELIYFVGEDVPLWVKGDPVRVRQILINLVGNALKFTEQGSIFIELGAVTEGRDDVLLSFSVKDTGIGISAEKKPLLFQAFRQVDGSMTRAKGGTGLGLAISRQLTELMGGTIDVESEPGAGSCFRFTVRCHRAGEKSLPAPRRLERKLRLLVAESHAVHARVLSSYLAAWGLEPVFVSTVDEARKTWKRAAERGQNFDVALLDLKGFAQASVALGQEMRDGNGTEVIFLVGPDRDQAEKSLEDVDAAAILAKPVRPSDLFNSLVAIASNSKARGIAPFYISHNTHARKAHFDARILVAEDNPVNQDVATGILENMGCRVVTAANGVIAARLMEQEKFDLVLMDCEMPEMDGFDAARCIRQSETARGDGRYTPIVALTAHALADIRQKCLEAGMDDFLTKPYDENQMSEALYRWIGRLACAPPVGEPAPRALAAPIGPAAPAEEAAINHEVLDNVSAFKGVNGEALFRRVVSRFAGTAPELAHALREQFDSGNAEQLWRIAHSLKSSASALGANRLAHRAGEIETSAREQGLEQVAPLLAGLDRELAAALHSLSIMTGESHEPALQRG
jgi:signal transduction histidine kinase/DNA-binding response OmpR family regulator/HPt (histidine-containing phosphotransfer) domain-containing protein